MVLTSIRKPWANMLSDIVNNPEPNPRWLIQCIPKTGDTANTPNYWQIICLSTTYNAIISILIKTI